MKKRGVISEGEIISVWELPHNKDSLLEHHYSLDTEKCLHKRLKEFWSSPCPAGISSRVGDQDWNGAALHENFWTGQSGHYRMRYAQFTVQQLIFANEMQMENHNLQSGHNALLHYSEIRVNFFLLLFFFTGKTFNNSSVFRIPIRYECPCVMCALLLLLNLSIDWAVEI